MKQRVCIAIAISLRPKVIIADEPTSALDVVVQRQVMETLRRVQEDLGAAIILIGHDMGLMAQFVDRLGVMYAGKLAEVCVSQRSSGTAASLQPAADRQPAVAWSEGRASQGIPGLPPSLLNRRPAAPSARAARRPWSAARIETPNCGRSGRTAASPAISTTWPRRNARERVGPP